MGGRGVIGIMMAIALHAAPIGYQCIEIDGQPLCHTVPAPLPPPSNPPNPYIEPDK